MAEPRLVAYPDRLLERSDSVGDAWECIAALDDPALRETRSETLHLLESGSEPLDRRARPGHLTGSALVVDHDMSHTLLLFHTKLRIWVQPGGHADGDANLAAVALREATEETGIAALRIWSAPIDLDIHEVRPPAEDPHFHHDVRFLVIAPPGAEFVGNHESLDHQWVGLDDLALVDVDGGVLRLAESAKSMRDRLVPGR